MRVNVIVNGGSEGREVRAVEGLADGGRLDRAPQSFVDEDVVQCGFCAPGLVVAGHDLLGRVPGPDAVGMASTR